MNKFLHLCLVTHECAQLYITVAQKCAVLGHNCLSSPNCVTVTYNCLVAHKCVQFVPDIGSLISVYS